MTDPGLSVVLPAVIETERIHLPLWDARTVDAIRSGGRLPRWHPDFPREDDVAASSLWRDGDTWGPRSILSLRAGLVMGSVGFFGPPAPADDGVAEVEIGYGLVAPARGHGAMSEVLDALLAFLDQAAVRVRASIAPSNVASLRLATRFGFTEVRGTTEDGEMVLVRPLR